MSFWVYWQVEFALLNYSYDALSLIIKSYSFDFIYSSLMDCCCVLIVVIYNVNFYTCTTANYTTFFNYLKAKLLT